MKKSNIKYLVLVCFGFLFLVLGGMSLMGGAFLENVVFIYVALGLIGLGAALYIALAILFILNYKKGRK